VRETRPALFAGNVQARGGVDGEGDREEGRGASALDADLAPEPSPLTPLVEMAPALPQVAARPDHHTEDQLAKAKLRHAWLRAIHECLAAGYSCKAAVAAYPQFSTATLSRLLMIAGEELGALSTPTERVGWILARPIDILTPGVSTGRKPAHHLTEQEALALRGLILARSTANDHTTANHFSLAVEQFPAHAACTPGTRAFIFSRLDDAARKRRLPVWPKAWRKQAYPTRQEGAKFRGVKSMQPLEQCDRRAMIWTDEAGQDHPLLAHTIWEMDDASDNEPRQSIDPDTGEAVLTRQTLWTQDVYSAALLGFSQVARSRDAYRIEDVADHVRNCIDAWGLPTFLRLEQGKIWNGSFFHGVKVGLAGWASDERWGGLDPLVRVTNVHKSKGKGTMEGSFNLLQAMTAHMGLSIGRVRGEFEGATKALTRAHGTGEIHERFWSMAKAAEAVGAVCDWYNARPKSRKAFGRDQVVPIDLLRDQRGAQPPASEMWRLNPIKRVATIRGGHVEVMVDHYPTPFRFRINGVDTDLHLDHGYSVLIAFHPGRPEDGCAVFNAELGSRNRDNMRKGEFLIQAPLAEWVAQIDLSGRGDFSPRRKANAAVNRAFRAIGQATRVAHSQDSHGTVMSASVGSSPATGQAPAPGSITAGAHPAPRRAKANDPFRCTTEDDWARQQERLNRIASATDAVTSDE